MLLHRHHRAGRALLNTTEQLRSRALPSCTQAEHKVRHPHGNVPHVAPDHGKVPQHGALFPSQLWSLLGTNRKWKSPRAQSSSPSQPLVRDPAVPVRFSPSKRAVAARARLAGLVVSSL